MTHHQAVVAHPHEVHARALLERGAPQVAVRHHLAVALGLRAHQLARREVLRAWVRRQAAVWGSAA